eukprot:jgi/Galph1/5603/GphlegSOOS_G4236.1
MTRGVSKEIGNLILDNVPEPSSDLLQRVFQYQTSRSSLVCDIINSGDRSGSILFSTRFGETANIHCIAGPGACREQQTFFTEPVYECLWQPNGRGFIYLKDVGGSEQFKVFYMDLETGTHHAISSLQTRGRCGSLVWNELGTCFCYYSTERNGKDWDIYLVESQKKGNGQKMSSPRCIFKGEGSWSALDFYRDRILLKKFVSLEESYLYVFDLKNPSNWFPVVPSVYTTGDSKSRSKAAISIAKFLRVSNDIEKCPIAVVSDAGEDFLTLRIHNSVGKPLKRIETGLLGDIEELAVGNILKQHSTVFSFVVNSQGNFELFLGLLEMSKDEESMPFIEVEKVSLPSENDSKEGQAWNLLKTTRIQLSLQQTDNQKVNVSVIRRLRLDSHLGFLAFSRYSPTSPGDIYTVQLDSKIVQRWTFGEVGGLDRKKFINPYAIQFESFDGLKIPCWMYLPNNIQDALKVPVLIHIHGGPEQQSLPVFTPLFQYLLLEKGIAILDPNVRGSSGYGKHYMSLDDQYRRKDAVKDIGALLTWIDQQPYLDNQRIALLGGSYGGFMVLSSVIEYGNRIRAAVDMVGISNFVSYLEGTASYRRDSRRREYGDERDPQMRQFLLSISPLTHSHHIRVPLFVAAGKNDPRVPAKESEQIVQAVRKNGLQCWYMVAKDEGHGYQRKSNR